MVDEIGNVSTSFTEGREVDLDHIEPVIEVFTKLSLSYRLLQISIRRADHAYIDFNPTFHVRLDGELFSLRNAA